MGSPPGATERTVLLFAGVLVDWLAMRRTTGLAAVLRFWCAILVHLATVWIAVGLIWTSVLFFQNTAGLGRVAFAGSALSFPLWCVVALVRWFYFRWLLLPWIADGATRRGRWIALTTPIALAGAAGVLSFA